MENTIQYNVKGLGLTPFSSDFYEPPKRLIGGRFKFML